MIPIWLAIIIGVFMQEGDTVWMISPDKIDTAYIVYDSSYTAPLGDYQMVQWNDIKHKHQVHWFIPAVIGFVVGVWFGMAIMACFARAGHDSECERCKMRYPKDDEKIEVYVDPAVKDS